MTLSDGDSAGGEEKRCSKIVGGQLRLRLNIELCDSAGGEGKPIFQGRGRVGNEAKKPLGGNYNSGEEKRIDQGRGLDEVEASDSETLVFAGFVGHCAHSDVDYKGSNGPRWRFRCKICKTFWSGPWLRPFGPHGQQLRAFGPCLP